ncbi:MAG: hypothetical protein NVSMB19_26390 [Vulcanimicrobiaceae bacterium]
MSAFLCSNQHISAILYAFARADRYTKHDDQALTEMGVTLLDANAASVAYRYPRDVGEAKPFKLARSLRLEPLTPVAALKLCQSLNYQSCERDDWAESPARKLLSRIESALVSNLPGYEEAKWAI